MKTSFKPIALLLTGICVFTIFCSCKNQAFTPVKPFTKFPERILSSTEITVEKIDGVKDDFIFGADLSSVLSLENSGVKFYDFEKNQRDVFEILSNCGVNTVRVRVWNNPFDKDGNGYGGGNCDVEGAVKIGKRANAYGMNLMVDFHYSDFWADPKKQQAPKAWKNLNVDEKTDALYSYTKDCLLKLNKEAVKISLVQIGNETNGAMAGENDFDDVCKLMRAGVSATNEIYPDAKTVLHFTTPEKQGLLEYYAEKLRANDVSYDVFATSYYPHIHGTTENLKDVLERISDKYDKQVMVAETSYCYTADDGDFFHNTVSGNDEAVLKYPFTVQGQADAIRDVIFAVSQVKNGIGVCYWECAWIPVGGKSYSENFKLWQKYGSGWATSFAKEYDPVDAGKYYGGSSVDNMALFDFSGNALESLKVFAMCR